MKYGKRSLCLLAATVLGLLASAPTAEAHEPQFLINGKPVGTLTATVTLVQVGSGYLSIPGLNFELKCETLTTLEGVISTSTDAKGTISFTGCTTLSISKLGTAEQEIPCEVGEPIKAEALLLPAELINGEPAVLAEKLKSLVQLFEPKSELTKPCVLPEDNTVRGELCLKLDKSDTVEPTVLASQEIQGECKARFALEGLCKDLEKEYLEKEGKDKLCKELTKEEAEKAEKEGKAFLDKMLYGAQEIFVNRTVKISLTGAHAGLTFGVSLL